MTKTYYPELDETLFREVLKCGLTVAVVPKEGFSKKIAYLAADFGSIHTDFTLDGKRYRAPAGTAHYLEHKLFDMPGGRDISGEFAALGASVNAFTSYDMTAYYFSCTKEFQACLRKLLEFVTFAWFPQERVDAERGIIDQEIGMNLDSPESMVFDDLMTVMYDSHPIRIPILGTRESIREITPQVLEASHRAFYVPENLLLCVVGDVDPEAVAATAREVLGQTHPKAGQKVRPWQESRFPVKTEIRRTMDVSMPTFTLGFKCPPTGTGEDAIRQEMVADLAAEALFGESSELYLRLYQEGTIDSSFGGGYETADGCAMLLCSGDSDSPEEIREAVIAQGEKLTAQGIPEADFLRMKRSALGRRIRALDSFDSTCFRICAYHFSNFDYFRFPEIYQSIRKEEIIAFLKDNIVREGCAISVVVPGDKEEKS